MKAETETGKPETTDWDLLPGMIDSHFHLLMMQNKEMPSDAILTECFRRGLSLALDIGVVARTFEARTARAAAYSKLYTAHGFYPSECRPDSSPESRREQLLFLENHLRRDPKAVALGEIGLDFYRDHGTEKQQTDLFIEQIELANSLKLPIIIHSRDAADQTLKVLKEHTPEAGGIMHCFSYDWDIASRFLDLGLHISFAGNITYKKTEAMREAARRIPADRLLVETDAPFLSPGKARGRRNHPGFIGHTYRFLAELRREPLEQLIQQVRTNFINWAGLDDKRTTT